MSRAYVVLAMHRTRSSMVAEMLNRMGINMGDEMLRAGPFNPYGMWEDVTFYSTNREILFQAGGNWAQVPEQVDIFRAASWLTEEMRWQVKWRADRYSRWGFKDPRSILTVTDWERFLPDPHYVICKRDREAVIDSLYRRAQAGGPGARFEYDRDDWADLYDDYDCRLRQFLEQNERPAIGVDTDLMVSRETAADEVARLADFVGGDPRAAYAAIRFKEDG